MVDGLKVVLRMILDTLESGQAKATKVEAVGELKCLLGSGALSFWPTSEGAVAAELEKATALLCQLQRGKCTLMSQPNSRSAFAFRHRWLTASHPGSTENYRTATCVRSGRAGRAWTGESFLTV